MLQAVILQFRILALLMGIETRRRFGSNISAMINELFEAGFILMIMVGIRMLSGTTAHRGMEIAPFIASGLIILLAFRSNFFSALGTPAAFSRLQNSLNFTILDLDIARAAVDFLIYVALAVALFSGLVVAGQSPSPENPLGLIGIMLLGSSFGLFLGQILREFLSSGIISRIVIAIIGRGVIWFSGALFVAPELPYAWRDLILLNPLAHITEMARTDYFTVYQSDHFSVDYVASWFVGLFVSALVVERAMRFRSRSA